MEKEIEIGNYYVVETQGNIYFISSNFSIWHYEEVKKEQKQIFVVLKELSLSLEKIAKVYYNTDRLELRLQLSSIAASAARAGTIARASSRIRSTYSNEAKWKIYQKIYDDALKEINATGEIKGYEAYVVSLDKKVWIGKSDFENLLKAEHE